MALLHILERLRASEGIHFDDPFQKTKVIELLNRVIEQFYSTRTLPGSEKTVKLDVTTTNQLITLPHFIDDIRGLRLDDAKNTGEYRDVENRFDRFNANADVLKWDDAGTSPLYTELSEDGPLTFTLKAVQVDSFSVVISGKTTVADFHTEELVFPPNTGTKTTSSSFIANFVRSIAKNLVPTGTDILITDAGGASVGTLHSDQKNTRYKVIRIADVSSNSSLSFNHCIEVLYKESFRPLHQDMDVFLDGSFDDLLFFSFLADLYSGREETLLKQQAAAQQVGRLLQGKNRQASQGKLRRLDYIESNSLRAIRSSRFSRYPYLHSSMY